MTTDPVAENTPSEPHGAVPCAAKSKSTGKPCAKRVVPPATVCYYHGGRARQVVAAVERRRQEAKLEQAVSELAAFSGRRDISHTDALLEALGMWASRTAYLAGLIAALESPEDLKQVSIGPGRERIERPAVLVEMLDKSLIEQTKVAKICHDVGIDERRTRIAESHGNTFKAIMQETFKRMFADFIARGMRADELRTYQREQLPAIVQAAMLAVIPPEELQGGSAS